VALATRFELFWKKFFGNDHSYSRGLFGMNCIIGNDIVLTTFRHGRYFLPTKCFSGIKVAVIASKSSQEKTELIMNYRIEDVKKSKATTI
jgi:hypothetical protein